MTEFKMVAVPSANISHVGHAGTELRITFRGKVPSTWAYDGVDKAEHAAMMLSDSVGRFFAHHIKPKYKGRKLEDVS